MEAHHARTPARAALDAVRDRLQVQLATALCKYAKRYDIPLDATSAELQKIPPHLWPTQNPDLAAASAFIRDHGGRYGIAPFDDDAKAILLAADEYGLGRGKVLEARCASLDKLKRRKANRRAERFFASKPRGKRATINTAIADHLIAVLERLAGRAVRASRYPQGSTSPDGEQLDGKPRGLLLEILLHALRLAQWRAALMRRRWRSFSSDGQLALPALGGRRPRSVHIGSSRPRSM